MPGDLRRVCDLFGIGIDAASRYAFGPDPRRFPTDETLRPWPA